MRPTIALPVLPVGALVGSRPRGVGAAHVPGNWVRHTVVPSFDRKESLPSLTVGSIAHCDCLVSLEPEIHEGRTRLAHCWEAARRSIRTQHCNSVLRTRRHILEVKIGGSVIFWVVNVKKCVVPINT